MLIFCEAIQPANAGAGNQDLPHTKAPALHYSLYLFLLKMPTSKILLEGHFRVSPSLKIDNSSPQ